MKFRVLLWIALASLAGCGGLAHQRPGSTLTVVNQSDFQICHLYVRPAARESWGHDWLPRDDRLAPAASRTFPVHPGKWSLRAEDCRGKTLFARHDLRVRTHRRVELRPIEVHRRPRTGARRFAEASQAVRRMMW